MLSIFLYTSCEKPSLQPTGDEIKLSKLISERWTEMCEDCDEGCCCGVELRLTTQSAYLTICGSIDGTGLCSYSSVPSPCTSTVSGNSQSTVLNSGNTKDGFCLVLGNSFSITNTHGTDPANIYVTCIYDQVNSQRLTLSIPAGETWFFDSNGDCQVARCQ